MTPLSTEQLDALCLFLDIFYPPLAKQVMMIREQNTEHKVPVHLRMMYEDMLLKEVGETSCYLDTIAQVHTDTERRMPTLTRVFSS